MLTYGRSSDGERDALLPRGSSSASSGECIIPFDLQLQPILENVLPYLAAYDLNALCTAAPSLRDTLDGPRASDVLLSWARDKSWFSELDAQLLQSQPGRASATALRGFVSTRGRRLAAREKADQQRKEVVRWCAPAVLVCASATFVAVAAHTCETIGIKGGLMAGIFLMMFVGILVVALAYTFHRTFLDPVPTGCSVVAAVFGLRWMDGMGAGSAWEAGSLRVYGGLHIVALIFGLGIGYLNGHQYKEESSRRDYSLPYQNHHLVHGAHRRPRYHFR